MQNNSSDCICSTSAAILHAGTTWGERGGFVSVNYSIRGDSFVGSYVDLEPGRRLLHDWASQVGSQQCIFCQKSWMGDVLLCLCSMFSRASGSCICGKVVVSEAAHNIMIVMMQRYAAQARNHITAAPRGVIPVISERSLQSQKFPHSACPP